jgi:hypothetical protein
MKIPGGDETKIDSLDILDVLPHIKMLINLKTN